MPNPDDFDPAKAVQGARQQRAAEEAKKQRAQAQLEERRANIRKLILYADEQLEEIRNPTVSEFVVTERWWTPEPKQIIVKRVPRDFRKILRPDQEIIKHDRSAGFFGDRSIFTVATKHERQTRYYGSWLSLDVDNYGRKGLVKLRQPHAGYAYVGLFNEGHLKMYNNWDPRNVGCIIIELTDSHGRETSLPNRNFQIFESLEEPAEGKYQNISVEELTKRVTQALDFVETGQPPPRPEPPTESIGWD